MPPFTGGTAMPPIARPNRYTSCTTGAVIYTTGADWFGNDGIKLHCDIPLEVILITIIAIQFFSWIGPRLWPESRGRGVRLPSPTTPQPAPPPPQAPPPPPHTDATGDVKRAAIRILRNGVLVKTRRAGKKLHLSGRCRSILNPDELAYMEICSICISNVQ